MQNMTQSISFIVQMPLLPHLIVKDLVIISENYSPEITDVLYFTLKENGVNRGRSRLHIRKAEAIVSPCFPMSRLFNVSFGAARKRHFNFAGTSD